jgi:MFS family permease
MLATYSRHLGAGPRFTGILQATYGLTQLMGAKLLGGLSDDIGRRRTPLHLAPL